MFAGTVIPFQNWKRAENSVIHFSKQEQCLCVIDCDISLISLFLFSDYHHWPWLHLAQIIWVCETFKKHCLQRGSYYIWSVKHGKEEMVGPHALQHKAKDIYGSQVSQEPGNSKFHGGSDRRVSSEISWSHPPFPHDSLLSVYEAGTLLYYSQSQLQGNPKFFNTNVKNFTPKNGTAWT